MKNDRQQRKSATVLHGLWGCFAALCFSGGELVAAAAEAVEKPMTSTWPVPFVIPLEDPSSGVTYFENGVAFADGRIAPLRISEAGHFTSGGQRLRLWGVNIVSDSAFPSHEEAKKFAARLRGLGVNIVRFHHLEHNWGSSSLIDYSDGKSQTLNMGNLEKMDFFIAELARQGIYSNLNLLTSREFTVADGLPADVTSLDWKPRQVFGFIVPEVRDLEKKYAKTLMEHVNPYTKLRYGEDPAIAFVEINNENGLFQQYFLGNMSKWPASYKQLLKADWNSWLQRKYDSQQAMLSEWHVVDEPLSSNLIKNGNFAFGMRSWALDAINGAVATPEFKHGEYLKIGVEKAGDANWHVQLHQILPPLAPSQVYTLKLRVRADSHTNLAVMITQSTAPWHTVKRFPITLSNEWTSYEWSFIVEGGAQHIRFTLGEMGLVEGNVYVTDASLFVGGNIGGLGAEETLKAGTIRVNELQHSYTAERNKDWMAFLYDREKNYWRDMRRFLTDTLQIHALPYGTIASLSPPSIQAEFGFIDSHNYWTHPRFPNGVWDKGNWTVDNIPMVNTLEGNTLDMLARQRVKGMPFVVSEYQHSLPNSYMAEAPQLIGAYAALQDWDGVYFFSFEKGEEGWGQGYFDSFMRVNEHPSFVANMAIAGNLFRRGDVRPAIQVQYLPYGPVQQIERLANNGRAWDVVPVEVPVAMTAFAFKHRLALDLDGNVKTKALPSLASHSVIESDTGELHWDTSLARGGVFRYATDRSAGVTGFVGEKLVELGTLKVTLGQLHMDWATWAATAQEGSLLRLEDGARVLIVATGRTENTDMRWTNERKISLGRDWGKAPTLIEVVPFVLELPVPPARVKAWSLDEKGQRQNALMVVKAEQGSQVIADGEDKTLWYELEIYPATP